MGRTIASIISAVPYLRLLVDQETELNSEVEANDIWYKDNQINIGEVTLLVKDGRLAFAQALGAFEEPKTNVLSHNMICNTEFSGPVKYGYFNTIGGCGFGYVRDGDEIIRMPHVGKVKIGKDVVIHNSVNIDRGVIRDTVIGDGCKIDSFVHIAHNVILGKNNTLAAHTIIEGSCEVGDNNIFGTSVIVLRKVKVGSNNLFGSGCVVTKDIGDNGVYVGNPARKLRDNE